MKGYGMTPLFCFILAYVQSACSTSIETPLSIHLIDPYYTLISDRPGNLVFEEACTKNGGRDAFTNLINVGREADLCLNRSITAAQIRKDIEELKPTGNVSFILSKYCKKAPAVSDCFGKIYPVLQKCVNKTEDVILRNYGKTAEAVKNFLCLNEGSALSSFIKEGGTDCAKENSKASTSCLVSFIKKYLPSTKSEPSFLMAFFKFGERECRDVHDFKECIIQEYKKCKKQTAAKFAESLSDYVIKQTPCGNADKKN